MMMPASDRSDLEAIVESSSDGPVLPDVESRRRALAKRAPLVITCLLLAVVALTVRFSTQPSRPSWPIGALPQRKEQLTEPGHGNWSNAFNETWCGPTSLYFIIVGTREECQAACEANAECHFINYAAGSNHACTLYHDCSNPWCRVLYEDSNSWSGPSGSWWTAYHYDRGEGSPFPGWPGCSIVSDRRDSHPPKCAARGENCWESKCCQDPSTMCYAKDLGWAECKPACTPGEVDANEDKLLQTKWLCAQLLEGLQPGWILPVGLLPNKLNRDSEPHSNSSRCSAAGHDCSKSMCCVDSDMTCYQKHSKFAMCKKECKSGIDENALGGGGLGSLSSSLFLATVENESESADVQTPWSCHVLSKELTEKKSPKPKLAPHKQHAVLGSSSTSGPSLFCFALMLPFGYEVDLIKSQAKMNAGMFLCNEHAVFSNVSIDLDSGVVTDVVEGSLKCDIGGKWNTALNSEIFVRVWRKVLSGRRFNEHDWTVKVDPDTVFLPSRLQQHVKHYMYVSRFNSDHRAYLNDCQYGLHGPIEALSHGAMEALAKGLDDCHHSLKWEFSEMAKTSS